MFCISGYDTNVFGKLITCLKKLGFDYTCINYHRFEVTGGPSQCMLKWTSLGNNVNQFFCNLSVILINVLFTMQDENVK
jgi:hypothetical protein